MVFDKLTETKITIAYLKRHGYRRIVWGAPDYYVELPKDEYGRTKFTGKRESTARWGKHSYAWEKSTHRGEFVYFPGGFSKYINVDNRAQSPNDSVLVSERNGSWSEVKLIKEVFTTNDLESVELSIL